MFASLFCFKSFTPVIAYYSFHSLSSLKLIDILYDLKISLTVCIICTKGVYSVGITSWYAFTRTSYPRFVNGTVVVIAVPISWRCIVTRGFAPRRINPQNHQRRCCRHHRSYRSRSIVSSFATSPIHSSQFY
jgi:hypothetical protein